MQPNPYLRRLGFADTDRVVIMHIDDVGMCQATLAAFAELVDYGLVSSGAAMVPCPWFPQLAAYCRAHPQVDMGVHLTLNSEWDGYRWGPLSTGDPASGLLDAEGYFPRTAEAVYAHAQPAVVQTEIQAQLQRAQAAGIDVTHADTHMLTLLHSAFFSGYRELLQRQRLPGILMRRLEHGFQADLSPAEADQTTRLITEMEAQGLPLLDAAEYLPLDRPEYRLEQIKHKLSELPAGLTHLLFHPATDTPELRAIAPDWPSRVADYEILRSADLRTYLHEAGVQIIGYRALREAWRHAAL